MSLTVGRAVQQAFPQLPSIAAKHVVTRVPAPSFDSFTTRLNSELGKPHKRPVISYKDGEHSGKAIPVRDRPACPPGQDEKKVAHPLDQSVLARLTPTMKKFTLFGKVAIVTGAARGLGLNMAQGLAEAGVSGIAIFDVLDEVGEATAEELANQTGIDVRYYHVDVTRPEAVARAVNDVAQHYGGVDILINSAGIADSNIKAEHYPIAKFQRLMDINVNGTFYTCQTVGRKMIESGKGGSIVNIASMSGTIVNYPQEQCCYNASKAGVIQLTRSLGAEWAKYNIRVNAISPGYMDTALNRVPALDAQKKIWTRLTPQARLGSVDDLNNLAVYLASEASSFMTGSNCIIDGGYTLW